MPVDRNFWKQHLTKHWAPAYPCPSCAKGTLSLVKDSLREGQTAASRRDRGRPDWDPTQDVWRFTVVLACGNKTCGETATVAGLRFTEPAMDPEDGSMTWELEYHPRYFDPPQNVFALPAKCPEQIAKELARSFRLVFVDANAAANRLRTAVERLLDAQGIKARARRKGHIVKLPLHDRIELFKKARPSLGDALMAVKWLGNAGTHEGNLSRDDVFDGYDIVEHVLEEVVTERTARVEALAKQINRQRGPRKRK